MCCIPFVSFYFLSIKISLSEKSPIDCIIAAQASPQTNSNNIQEFKDGSHRVKNPKPFKTGCLNNSTKNIKNFRNANVDAFNDVPEDILLADPVENTLKYSSGKRKKSVKGHSHERQASTSECTNMSLEPKEEQIIPKLILSRNTTDWNKYEVRESVVGNLGAGTKRRRSTENDHNDVNDVDNCGKRPKTTQPSSAVNDSVLMVPSIPIKLDRRLSGDKNGEK